MLGGIYEPRYFELCRWVRKKEVTTQSWDKKMGMTKTQN
jgi:hypothetical protein